MINLLFRTNFFLLLLAFFLAVSCQQAKKASTDGYTDINVEQFKAKMDATDVVILDVRTPEETADGMIEGAVEIDYNGNGFQEEVGQLDRDKTYLIYCRSGGRSSNACEDMQKMGFKKLYNLDGGYLRWSAENQ